LTAGAPQTAAHAKRRKYSWLRWAGGAVGLAGLVWVLSRIDFEQFLSAIARAEPGYILLVLLGIAGEQWVRAWKWRQLLWPIRPIATIPLFGSIMAGYFGNLVIPVGVSALIRSWLVARRENLRTSTVLATAALDRLIDGIVFSGFIPIVLVLVAIPDPTGGIRAGLGWSGGVSLALFISALVGLAAFRLSAERGGLGRCIARLPVRLAEPLHRLAVSFSQGIVWPAAAWRRAGIIAASFAIKLIAATHFLWAGLALGVVLRPADYLFLLVFLGFVHVISHFGRVPAGFTVGAVFALGLLGVAEEQALAMTLIVQGGSLLTISAVGALALWVQGVGLAEIRTARAAERA
jgi:hypothetical protein